jgi:hypothetical protein
MCAQKRKQKRAKSHLVENTAPKTKSKPIKIKINARDRTQRADHSLMHRVHTYVHACIHTHTAHRQQMLLINQLNHTHQRMHNRKLCTWTHLLIIRAKKGYPRNRSRTSDLEISIVAIYSLPLCQLSYTRTDVSMQAYCSKWTFFRNKVSKSQQKSVKSMQSVGIEPTLLRTRALSVRLNRSAKTAIPTMVCPGPRLDVGVVSAGRGRT